MDKNIKKPICKVCNSEIKNNLKICIQCNKTYHSSCGNAALCNDCLKILGIQK